jgi:hypothetical protein
VLGADSPAGIARRSYPGDGHNAHILWPLPGCGDRSLRRGIVLESLDLIHQEGGGDLEDRHPLTEPDLVARMEEMACVG